MQTRCFNTKHTENCERGAFDTIKTDKTNERGAFVCVCVCGGGGGGGGGGQLNG